jgi:protein gp37
MGERSAIEWTDATFNPWWGCTEISPACDHCYARTWAHRLGYPWGLGAPRREFGDAHWREPYKWARTLPAKLGRRPRVFCASMADVLDKDAPAGARERLWALIVGTPELDWLILTKRIGNARTMMTPWFESPSNPRGELPPNVWLGATIANQEEADRDIPKLLDTPARVRFLSMEPLLGPVRLSQSWCDYLVGWETVSERDRRGDEVPLQAQTNRIDWVIVGGESGANARPFTLGYAKELVAQCRAVGVPVFVKQVGARPVNREGERCPHITHKKGADMAEWPDVLQVREFPR